MNDKTRNTVVVSLDARHVLLVPGTLSKFYIGASGGRYAGYVQCVSTDANAEITVKVKYYLVIGTL